MLRRNLKVRCAIALTAGIAATSIVVQQRTIRQLREENTSLCGQIDGLVGLIKENEVLSGRLAEANTTRFSPDAPSHELLRLRGEVGMLRRQLLERQQLPSAQSTTQTQANLRPSAETLRMMEAILIERQPEYARAKTISEQLKEKASDPEALAQALQASGLQDNELSSWLEQREIAVQKLGESQKDHSARDPQTEDLANQVADLKAKIEARSQGLLLGLDARAESMKRSLDALQNELAKARGTSQ
jgi:hypothetical protein